MRTKRYLKGMIAALAVSGMCWQTLAVATENVQPNYTDAAAAGHAAHMARQGANTTDPSLQAALADVNAAEEQMSRMQVSGNQSQMMTAETNLNNAEDRYVGMLSRMSGVSEAEIGNMHATGASWAEISSELGVQMGPDNMGDVQMGQGMGTGTMPQGNMGNTQMGQGMGTGTMPQGNMGDTQMGQGMGSGTMPQDNMSGTQMGQGGMGTQQMVNGDVNSMMGSRAAEIMGATARNNESGWSEGHGTGMATGGHGTDSGGMMSGAGGLGNDMGGGSGGGMGGSGGGGGMGGSSGGGGMGGSGGGGGTGGSGGGGGMGGSGGGGGMGGSGGGGGMGGSGGGGGTGGSGGGGGMGM